MNWAGQNERQAIRPVIRAQMRARNLLDFCDEDGREFSSDVDRQYAQTMANWRMQAGAMYPLQIYAVQATSTDHSEQDIGECDACTSAWIWVSLHRKGRLGLPVLATLAHRHAPRQLQQPG